MKRSRVDGKPQAVIEGPPRITSLRIQGYRPFGDFHACLGLLQAMVGANASGKSSLFEFLKFVRDAVRQDIPPEIVAGSIGQQVFHRPGPERFSWMLEMDLGQELPLQYEGQIMGPVGRAHVHLERVQISRPAAGRNEPLILMDVREGQGRVCNAGGKPA
ncbi:MAG: hypothetical protein FJ272_14235, partial [Planctomycetes bacterium]|nr:hypothetical protein [Planctomycetota bacterium]